MDSRVATAVRSLALLVLAAAGLAAALHATAPLRHAPTGRGPRFGDLLVVGAGWLLVAGAAWAGLMVAAVLAEALTRGRVRSGWLACPAAVRRCVLLAVGAALVAGPLPATATTSVPPDATGLPVPARTTGGAGPGGPAHVVVAPGDSLWAIAATVLPRRAGPAAIASGVRRLHAANRRVIGADPDHLEPGQRLRVPADLADHTPSVEKENR